tara:strand:- start:79 stop:432 length:354 start_codon:yes stop_codon:yes gene_type:complete
MFSEIEEIKDTLNYVDDNWNDEKFSDIWQEANTLVKERLTNTDYQFLDIKRKMNILHILCVVTHINNTYSMSININKFLENVAKLNFVAAANGIKLQINNSNKTNLANHMSRMIKNI